MNIIERLIKRPANRWERINRNTLARFLRERFVSRVTVKPTNGNRHERRRSRHFTGPLV